MLINFAIETIKADEEIKYSEVKFFKEIRYHLKLSNQQILLEYPDIESFLKDDIDTNSGINFISSNYLNFEDFPQIEIIK